VCFITKIEEIYGELPEKAISMAPCVGRLVGPSLAPFIGQPFCYRDACHSFIIGKIIEGEQAVFGVSRFKTKISSHSEKVPYKRGQDTVPLFFLHIKGPSFLCVKRFRDRLDIKGTLAQGFDVYPKVAHGRLDALMARQFRDDGKGCLIFQKQTGHRMAQSM